MSGDDRQSDQDFPVKARPNWGKRLLAGGAAFIVLASVGSAVSSLAHGRGDRMDVQSAQEWAALGSRQVLRKVDATPDQQARIEAIVAAGVRDLFPLRQQMRQARDNAIAILSAPNVNPEAAERLRAEQIALHDQASKRLVQDMLAIAEVLTPEQRQKLAAEAGQWRGRR